MHESVSVVQTHSNRSENKNAHNSHVNYETVVIPRIVILKPRTLYDLDRQPSKIRNLKKKKNFSVRKVLENFKTALALWSHLKRPFSEPPQKVLVFVCFYSFILFYFIFFHCFVVGNNIYLVDFHDTHLNDIWLFQNRFPGSLDHLTLTPSWQGKRQRT